MCFAKIITYFNKLPNNNAPFIAYKLILAKSLYEKVYSNGGWEILGNEKGSCEKLPFLSPGVYFNR